jgi:hypothetical protein
MHHFQMSSNVLNKEFLETNYPQGKPQGYFAGFILTLGSKTEILYLDSRFHGNDNFSGNPDASIRGILFD